MSQLGPAVARKRNAWAILKDLWLLCCFCFFGSGFWGGESLSAFTSRGKWDKAHNSVFSSYQTSLFVPVSMHQRKSNYWPVHFHLQHTRGRFESFHPVTFQYNTGVLSILVSSLMSFLSGQLQMWCSTISGFVRISQTYTAYYWWMLLPTPTLQQQTCSCRGASRLPLWALDSKERSVFFSFLK